ncbi:hypothetical protein CHU94_03270 [Rhodoferax sp. TH121]|nr:hypothetical protein CHU94_03270 [Rhodoferax sp. TH121]
MVAAERLGGEAAHRAQAANQHLLRAVQRGQPVLAIELAAPAEVSPTQAEALTDGQVGAKAAELGAWRLFGQVGGVFLGVQCVQALGVGQLATEHAVAQHLGTAGAEVRIGQRAAADGQALAFQEVVCGSAGEPRRGAGAAGLVAVDHAVQP